MTTNGNIKLDEIAERIMAVLPTLDVFEQSLSIELYRLLASGQPVPRAALARRLGTSLEKVERILDGWPGVFSDSQGRVIGYWGLALPDYESPHRLTVDGRRLSAWCAWDTLFLPQLLGTTAQVESTSPGASIVRLTVTSDGVQNVDPIGTHMSFILPDAAEIDDVVTEFCHFVHFFPTRQSGESWASQRPGTFIMSMEDALLLARRKNEAQYKNVLASMQ